MKSFNCCVLRSARLPPLEGGGDQVTIHDVTRHWILDDEQQREVIKRDAATRRQVHNSKRAVGLRASSRWNSGGWDRVHFFAGQPTSLTQETRGLQQPLDRHRLRGAGLCRSTRLQQLAFVLLTIPIQLWLEYDARRRNTDCHIFQHVSVPAL